MKVIMAHTPFLDLCPLLPEGLILFLVAARINLRFIAAAATEPVHIINGDGKNRPLCREKSIF